MKVEFVKYVGAAYSTIITHPGKAHRDDLLACSVALAVAEEPVPILRRNPSQDELHDASFLVLDIGGEIDPIDGNFDHHQWRFEPYEEPFCALSLFAKRIREPAKDTTLHDALMLTAGWYPTLIATDVFGPTALSKRHGVSVEDFQDLTGSPTDGFLTRLFEHNDTIYPSSMLWPILYNLGKDVILNACVRHEELSSINPETFYCLGIRGAILKTWSPVFDLYRREQKRLGTPVTIAIYPDDRGPGWTLFRYDDDPRVDFSRLTGNESILFAHRGGFTAKTKSKCPMKHVMVLISLAMNKVL